jgi:UDP-N-acetylmuramoyl-L-alanyl-D-glutamate--2,6-diaminopimelate ligase
MTLFKLANSLLEFFPNIVISDLWMRVEIERIQTKSSDVQPGDLFVAIKGSNHDSHLDLLEVIKKNPSALLIQKGVVERGQLDSFAGPIIEVESSRRALAILAQDFYGNPSRRLFCIGVTGTNGKTSVSCMIEHLLSEMKIPTARIGTLGKVFNGSVLPSMNTTPGPLELAKLLRDFELQGARVVVMEVSSHALDQYRVDGISFNSVVFLNLTHDHLDYHGTMENYFRAKQRLFTDLVYSSGKKPILACINLDDPWASRLQINSKASIVTFGQTKDSDLCYQIKNIDWNQTQFEVKVGQKNYELSLPLVGAFNVSNFLAAFCAISGIGLSLERAARLMSNFRGVPGRMQRVLGINKIVFIDYAHTPDALSNTLSIVREIRDRQSVKGHSRIWVVFGCGGDRDRAKRPVMGQIAESLADVLVITSDNPRSENPSDIIEEIWSGIQGNTNVVHKIEDRAEAIAFALKNMEDEDILIVAGKGHEVYQEIQGVRIPFSDYDEVLKSGG